MSIYKVLELAQYDTDEFEEGVLIPSYAESGSLAEFDTRREAEGFIEMQNELDEDGEFFIAWVE